MTYPRIILTDATQIEMCRWKRDVQKDEYDHGLGGVQIATHGIENNPEALLDARGAEVALCLYLGLDPMTAMLWQRHGDPGYDVRSPKPHFYDVKHVFWHRRLLIWPVKKNNKFERYQFDRLVLVRGHMPEFEICGWATKDKFRAQRLTSGPGHKLPDVGTWHMDIDQLNDPALLRRWHLQQEAA